MRTLIICSFILFFISTDNLKGQPDSVNCYIEVQDIWDLDFNRGTSMVDFYLTIKYKEELNKEFTLLNGTIVKLDTLLDNIDAKDLKLRVLAEIRNSFEFRKYPLDKQQILIKLEPFQYANEIVVFSEKGQNIFVGDIHINGWTASEIKFEHKVTTYEIHENGKTANYFYSNASFIIPISREQKFLYAFKIFIPSIISILIIYIGFFLPPSNIESRLNLSVGSLFVMISNFIVTQQMLPNISSITLVEKVNILSLIIVFLTILYFAISYRVKTKLSNSAWRKINWIFGSVMTGLYLILAIVLL